MNNIKEQEEDYNILKLIREKDVKTLFLLKMKEFTKQGILVNPERVKRDIKHILFEKYQIDKKIQGDKNE